MFKKIAIGCAIAAVLLAVVGGIASYWVYSKAKTYVGSMKELGDVTSMEQQVTNKASFEPPDTHELTPEQVQRFTALNEQVQSALGPKFAQLKQRYDELEARRESEGREASVGEAFQAVSDLTGVVKDVRSAQVAALNAQRMSVDEYRWIRDRVYDAAGIPISVFNVGAFVEAAKSGKFEELAASPETAQAGDIPEGNRELVKPLGKKLEEWAPIAWLGF